MLTADMVHARKYKGELRLLRIEGEARARAIELADGYVAHVKDHVGRTREELVAAWDAWDADHPQRRIAAGLRKILEDGCTFDAEPPIDPVELRRRLFRAAAAERRALPDAAPFPREGVLAKVGAEVGLDAEAVERLLFADTRGAHVLLRAPEVTGEVVLQAYELAQAQAVLLRAVRVTCDVELASPGAARALFAKLKFLQLLFRAERKEDGRYRIVLDGPYSLFDAVTRYGVKLAMLLPALAGTGAFTLEADVRWGKAREALLFRMENAPVLPREGGEGALGDDAAALLRALQTQSSPWRAEVASTLLDLPGHGIVVPDLVFTRPGFREPIYLEVMGYWSRDAVFRRLELVEQGLAAKIVFAVSSRLRVSEELLPEDASSALYVYKGVMSARAVLERVTALSQR